MSVADVTKIECSADLEGLAPELLKSAQAGLAAGYQMEIRIIRYQTMLFADNKHFYPMNNMAQCIRLVVDTHSSFCIQNTGLVSVNSPAGVEYRSPKTDDEYRNQICDAIVTNIAKGYAPC